MNRSIVGIVVALFAVASGIAAYGFTNSSVTGTVIDELTGKPLLAQLDIDGKPVESDSTGKFSIKGRPGEIKTVVFSKGYEKTEQVIDIPFLVGKDVGVIKLKNGVIRGKISEDAVTPQEITTATVSIAGTSTISKNGQFEIKGIPVGKHKVKIDVPSHESFEQELSIKGGINSLSTTITLTADETLRRYFNALQYKDYEAAYENAHPDAKATFSKTDFVTDRKADFEEEAAEIESYSIGQTRLVSSWTDEESGKTYQNVAEIEASLTVRSPSFAILGGDSSYTYHQKVHWVKVGGRWHNFPTL